MTEDGRFPELSPERRELLKLLLEDQRLPARPLRRTSTTNRFPLSFVQERMWIAEKFTPAGAYTTCIDTRGRLDVAVLEKALSQVVRRHEILRSTFDAEAPVQTVHEPSSVKLAFRDLRALPESTREAETRRFVEEESARPFDLVRGPLLRFSLFWLGEERHLLVISIHHLIFDGWSAGVFSREVAALYEAFSRGQPPSLPELPIQYGDFARWQREWAESEAVLAHVSYWKRQLGGELPPLLLPRDRPAPSVRTFRSGSLEFQLAPELHRGVERLSREAGVTPFMTLLAAFQAVLHLSTGQEDIVVGSPAANRNPVETEGLIGCFMHPLVLRTSLSGDPSFRELLARTREVCLEAYAHQDAPFEVVVREIRPRWDGRQMPLFQVLFNVQRARLLPSSLPGLVMTPTIVTPSSALDMTVHLWTGAEAIEGMWEYGTELFERATVEWLAEGYRWILERVVEDADRKISTLAGWEAGARTSRAGSSPERRQLVELLLAEEGGGLDREAIPRLPRSGEPVEASFGQERLWFFEQLEPGRALFNESVGLRLEGRLEVDVLERTWRELLRRQESLRTSFVVEDGRPKQRVESEVELSLLRVDLRGLSREEQEERVRGWMKEEVEKPFDLSRAPLLRLALLGLSEEEHVLVVTGHHIIADGWSGEVWQREMAAVYEAYAEGKESPLLELEVQYADYAVWQRERMKGPWVHEEIAYWRRALGGELPVLELPVDRRREEGRRRGRGETERFEIPPGVQEKLRELLAREGTTLFMTLLAAFQALLHRYTGEEDILVDTVLAGRSRAELEAVVGFFVNSAILRTDVSGNPTFRELLGRVKRVCLGALEHQEVPFDRVVSELGVSRRGIGGTLTPVSFMLHEGVTKRREMGGVVVSPAGMQPNDEFDLTLLVWQEPEGLTGQWKYDGELFEPETVRRMAKHYVRVLEEVVKEPEVRVGEMGILTEEERREVLEGWNETSEEVRERECIHERFEASAEKRGESIAVRLSKGMREEGREYELSYGELEKRANQLARYLRKRGVRAETRVGLCVGRSLELGVGLLGILKSGGAYVPLDASQPRERLKKVLASSGVEVVVTRREERERLSDLLSGFSVVEVEETRVESGERVESGVRGENAAYVMYTSGSTGEPKGVVVSHGSVVNHNVSVARRFGLRETDRVLQFHTVSFDAAVEEIFPTWMSGATLVMRGEDPPAPGAELARLIEEEGLTVLNLPTTYWHEWVDESSRLRMPPPPPLRLVIVGGDQAFRERYAEWRDLTRGRVRWLNTYGPTETTVVSTLDDPEREGDYGPARLSIGRPIGNTQAYVLDGRLEPVPIGVAGELYIGGRGVSRGYHERPDLTAEKFVSDPYSRLPGARLYRTGDRARFLADGRIEFLGRVDRQFKLRGFRIEAGEVESALVRHPDIAQAVVRLSDGTGARRLLAYIVVSSATPPGDSDLRDFLRQRLPVYMLPSAFVILDAIPRLPGGKVDFRALSQADNTGPDSSFVAPRTPAERELARIFSEVLGVAQVSIHDNFFQLGGDSILSLRIVSRASNAGLTLSPKHFFQYQTIAELASASGSTSGVRAEQGIVTGALPLTPVQRWFFEQRLAHPHRFIHSLLFELRRPLDPALLERAFSRLLEHHDALRMRFVPDTNGWRELDAGTDEDAERAIFRRVDLRAPADGDLKEAIDAAVEESQASLDLSAGPLVRVSFLETGGRRDLLLVTIHHLIVDGVSWGILIEDLISGYEQLQEGRAIELPPKTTSFREWSERLAAHAKSQEVREESAYWREVVRGEIAPLPRDFLQGENDLASADTVLVSLDPADTESLLRGALSAEVQINAVLLAALARALRFWTGAGSFLVNLEGHGRVDLFEDTDISRTVGWFTTLFPLRLTAGAAGEREDDLRRVKDELRGIPLQGIGYGLLSYLHGDEELERSLRGADREISFNYLGQLDLSLSRASPLAARFAPTSVRPSGRRAHLIDVNAMVIGGGLQTAWTYSRNIHRREGIIEVAEVYQRELRELLTEVRSPDRASSLQKRPVPRVVSEPPIPRAPAGEMPLSFAQQRLWFLDQLSPGSTLYNGQGAVRLVGPLDVDAMRRSIQEIARRHEILRTRFPATDGRPVQVVDGALPPIPVVDLEYLTADAREDEARRRAGMEMARSFDLTTGPLVRIFLFRLASTDHVLLFTVHHIAVDGWSLGVLIREVAALYQAFSSGEASPLPEPPIQYADYAIWQRQRLRGKLLADELAYWREKLSALSTLDLPADRPRPAGERRFRPAEELVELEMELWTSLRELMQREGVTPFILMLAAFDILLSRCCTQEDVAVGAAVANRGRPETQELIGFFVNTLVLRTDLSGNPTFRELLSRVRETTFDALSHQDLPFEKLVEELQPERDLSRTPLFQVFLNMVDAEEKSISLPGLRLEPFLPPVFETKFDLTLDVYDRRGRCGLRLSYNADLFEAATIRRMMRQLRTLLSGIAADPEKRLAELPLLDEAERRELLVTWNDTRADYRRNVRLHELFEEQAARTPGATAVVFENERLTYRELDERSNQLAHRLRELGVGPDSVVGICAERSLELIVALYGVLKSGAAYAPLDPEYPPERLSYMLQTSRTAVLLVQQRFLDLFPGYAGPILAVDADDFSRLPTTRAPTSTRPGQLAYVIFTSGSTGQPKGVMVPHEGLCNQLFWMQQTYGLDATDRVLQKTPFSFDVSVWELFWPLLFGSAIVIAKPQGHRDAVYLAELIRREGITTAQFVPSMLQAFVEEPGAARCRSLRRVICIGEALPFDLKERFLDRIGAELHNLYGPTEASLGVTAWACSRRGDSRVPIGRPMANTETYVLDRRMQPVPVGVQGELYLGGVQLARGYVSRPELTAECFVPHPFSRLPGARLYRTGDRVRFLPDGNIEFLGRWDHQVKIRGFRIELNEIEAVLTECPSVGEAAVVAREDRPGDKLLVAYVVPREDPAGSSPEIAELRERLRRRLPEYMVPAAFVVLDRLPLSPNGKLDRKALPPPEFSAADSRSAYVPPRSAIEQQLVEIWADVLPVPRVGVHDNFFDLGGHSLLATQVVSRIRQSFDVALPVRVMFDAPTVAGVAESVEAAIGKPRASAMPIPRADREGGLALSFVQERGWVTDQLVQAAGGGSMGGALRLRGPLDAGALERSILEIVRRHEVLRTRFPRVGERRVLSVEDDTGDVWSVRDLRDVEGAVRETEALRVAREEIGRSFDLSAGPLARATLVRLTEAEHLLVMAAHHTVADGWSAGLFFQELEALYSAHARGEPSPLPPLPIQYADYAAWQRAWSEGPELQEQLDYWSDRLSDPLPALELPLDHPRPDTRTFGGASQPWTFSADASRALAELSRHEGVTLFMTLLAGFQALLHGATGQEDIVIGSPVANRNHVEVEKLIGCFMQPLVLRTDLSGDPTFRQLLERVREVCLVAYAHQEIPFELVARALRPEWVGNQSPLFQVLFNVQREEEMSLRLPGLTPSPVELGSEVSVLDLSVHLWAGGREIRGVVEYSTELFEASTIEWLGARYRGLMAAAAAGPDRRLSELWAIASAGRPATDATQAKDGLSAERRELLALLLEDDPPGWRTEEELVRRPRTDALLAASFGQERLWFFEQLSPGSAFFNESVGLRLEGRLEVDVLERTWQELSRRQESLRTSFVVEDGRPKQRVESEVELSLLRVDLRGLSREEQEERVRGWMKEEVEKPFDLSRAPLLRLVLLRLSAEEHVLVVTGHHIIADGWSGEVWQREMAAVYEAYAEGKESPLLELEVQYADYAVWQRERMRGPWVHEELAYWKRALGGELPVLELPVDRRREEGRRRGRGETERFEIPSGLQEKLRELLAREGTTLFMTLLAGFQALLHRYTGEEDILVDTVLAGRSRAELEAVVGFFVNSAILRTDVSGNPTFRELLGRVKRVCLGALEHQEVPFDRVVSEVGVSRRGTGGTLTPVSFMLHEGVTKRREMGGVRVSPAGIEPNDEFDLTLLVWQEPEGLTGQWKYDRDLFDAETIRRMAEHYVRVLEEVVREPEVRVGEIAVLTEEERREVLEGWNDTREETGDGECIHERFEESAEKRGESIAVRLSKGMREEGREYELSYGELEKRANQLARYLRKRGVRAETRVGLCVGRSLELGVGLLGILKSGGAYVPLDASQPKERLKKILSSSGVEVVVTRGEERERLSELLAGLSVVEVEETRGESTERVESGVRGENAAYVMYTSGSTGEPKGVVVSHGSVVNHNVSVARRFGLRETDRVLQFHTVSFDAAVEEIFPTWMSGATLVMRGEELVAPGEELERLVEEEELTVLNLPTAYWHEWVLEGERRKKIEASGLRLVVVGGDKASGESYERWRELAGGGVRWVNTYGPTETTVVSSLYEPEAGAGGEVTGGMSIGRPIGNTRMYVLDSRMEPVPVGVGGELWVGGRGVARGYLGRPELTAERFVADPFAGDVGARMYRTGDRARYRRDGRIEFLGRVDEQVKIRGFRVEPAEVQSALLKHPAVDRAMVTGWKASPTETRLVAYVVPAGDSTALVPQLRGFLQSRLPDYMIPSAFVLLDSLPMTAAGKLDRRALPEPEPGLSDRSGFLSPRTPTEEVLAGIWADVLGVDRVGIDDNFFELGGHSLKASELMYRIRESFAVDLPLRTAFESPTVAMMATSVDARVASGAGFSIPRVEAVPREGPVPLSYAQEGAWWVDRLEPGIPFNIPIVLRLEGDLRVEILEAALNEVVRRHEVLRTNFSSIDGEPVQLIAEHRAITVPCVDLGELPDASRSETLLRELAHIARTRFDLSNGPLLRMAVFRVAARDHVLIFTVHHSVFDGWSANVLAREIAELYASMAGEGFARLPPLPVQYADYAVWQRKLLQGEFVDSQVAYWTAKLEGAPSQLNLPVDSSSSPDRLFRGASSAFALPRRLSESLRSLGRSEGVTLFMLLLAAFKSLLARYTGQEDLVVGTPVANRSQVETHSMIGFCVNLLALRTDLSGNPSFRALVRRVRETCLGAFGHQDLPFGQLVRHLAPVRDVTQSPIFQAQFALHAVGRSAFELPDLRISSPAETPLLGEELTRLLVDATPANDPLFVHMMDSGEELSGIFHYRADLFDPETIRRMAEHYVRVLEEVVREPEVRVGEIAVLTEEERREVLEGWNDTREETGDGECIHERFEESAEKRGESIAVRLSKGMREEGREYELSYGELEKRANQLARYLRKRGVRAETRVGLCVGRSLELGVGLLGILKSGGAYVPLDASQPKERLKKILSSSGVEVVVTRGEERERLSELLAGLSVVEVEETRGESTERVESGVRGENAAYVMYTSGSTGEPKGVVVSHGSVVNHNVSVARRFGLRETDRVLQFHTVSFDAAVEEIFPTWMSGATLVMRGEELVAPGEELERLVEEEELTVLNLPTAYWHEWVLEGERRKKIEASGLRLVVVGGDKASGESYERWRELAGGGVRWVNTYGPTETTVVSSLYEPEAGAGGEVTGGMSIGRPIGNTRMYVLDSRMEPVPVGVGGELWVGGRGVARGYLGRPELTAERFVADPFAGDVGARMYRTGDRARYRRDGRIEFLGRVDEQVKIRGFRVEPAEIEAALKRHTRVRDAVVLGIEHRGGEKRLFAFVIPAEGQELTAAELREFLNDRLPVYMVPAGFVFVTQFPSTPAGKIDRRALAGHAALGPASDETYVEPRTSTEKELARIWSELLGVPRIGVNDNFFALGGHSLLAAKAVSRLRNQFQVDVSLRDLFLRPTVAGVAQAIERALATGMAAPTIEIDLEREAELDAGIAANGRLFQFPAQPARVLLTGATGFVGASLLRELLDETSADVYCLVRADSPDDGSRKLRQSLEKFGLWDESAGARIVPVPGDLSERRLGLSEERFADLGRDLDVIYHNGAWVNALYPYAMMKAANVQGTLEVLRLACDTKIKPVHYVSTLSVFPPDRWALGVMDEQWIVEGGNSLHGGYAQSKWVAERLVSTAAERGLPVSVYRLGRVSGDSRTGIWMPDPLLIDSLKTILDLGSVPRIDDGFPIDLVPVDYVAKALVCLSRQPESLGKAFHLVNPRPTTWREFVDRLSNLGSPIRELTPERWAGELVRFARRTPGSFLHPLLPLLPSELLARLEAESEVAPAAEGGGPPSTGSAGAPHRIDCTNTLQGLEESRLTCPPAGALLDMYLSYFVRSGMLTPSG